PVAIKQFRKPGTRSFQLELSALMRIGVHPHIVRLLESYSGDSEDALVLEYCDSLTLYDLVVRRHHTKEQFGNLLVSRLIHQLLLAVDHVASCGISHQDVKPENLMLCDLSVEEERVRLKLGDFGWAVLSADQGPPAPAGAGSLWYAPPELNPPVDGTSIFPGAVVGKSDMWSSGVVIYLLLVGHNPFYAASKLKDVHKVEQEVIRMVAKGSFDRSSPAWTALSKDVK
ncbi:CPK3, partial [Symbiodinium pilosum]